MGDPQTVAGQLAGRGDEVARLRAERDEATALLRRAVEWIEGTAVNVVGGSPEVASLLADARAFLEE